MQRPKQRKQAMNSKKLCVLGVLKTEIGLKIKEEMMSWLTKSYEVITVEQETPGRLYELPGISLAADLAVQTNHPVLYLHTKGAAMPNNAQPMVRKCWEIEFGRNGDRYFELAKSDKPTVVAPLVARANRVCWFNGFVLNPAVAYGHADSGGIRDILEQKEERMWFEQGMLRDIITNVVTPYGDMGVAETPEEAWPAFLNMYKQLWENAQPDPKLLSHDEDFAVVAILRDEEPYVIEWLNWYRKLGCKRFYLLDNNDEGNNSLVDLLNTDEKNTEDVIVVDVRGDLLPKIGYQSGAYKKIYDRFRDRHDYMGFFDLDEFLCLNGRDFKTWLSESRETVKHAGSIQFNWRYFGDNGNLRYEDKPVVERFPTPCDPSVKYAQEHPEDLFTKVIVRCDRPMKLHLIHSVVMNDGSAAVHSNGDIVQVGRGILPIDFSNGCVNHYGTKSIEEYVKRKCLFTKNAANPNRITAEDRIKWFFNVNEDTPEKRAIIRELMGEQYNG